MTTLTPNQEELLYKIRQHLALLGMPFRSRLAQENNGALS